MFKPDGIVRKQGDHAKQVLTRVCEGHKVLKEVAVRSLRLASSIC